MLPWLYPPSQNVRTVFSEWQKFGCVVCSNVLVAHCLLQPLYLCHSFSATSSHQVAVRPGVGRTVLLSGSCRQLTTKSVAIRLLWLKGQHNRFVQPLFVASLCSLTRAVLFFTIYSPFIKWYTLQTCKLHFTANITYIWQRTMMCKENYIFEHSFLKFRKICANWPTSKAWALQTWMW